MSGRTSSPLLFFRKRFPRSVVLGLRSERPDGRVFGRGFARRGAEILVPFCPRIVVYLFSRAPFRWSCRLFFVSCNGFRASFFGFGSGWSCRGAVVPDIRGAVVSAAEMRLYKDTGMVAAIWLVAGLLAGSGLIVGRNPRMSSRCASSSDAGLAGRKARRAVLRVFLGSAFVTAAGGTLTLALGWRGTTWLFLTAPVLVALIAAIGMSAGESRRSSDAAVVPVLLALLFGLPALVAGYAVFSLRDPSLSLSPDRLRIGGLWGTDSVERTFFRPSGRHAAFRRGTDGRARYGNDPQGLFPAERYRYGEADADLGQGSVHLYAKTIGTVCRFEFRRGGTNGPLVRTDKRDAR